MRVQVKQLDIDRGERGEPATCPVARAIRRALRKIGRYPGNMQVGIKTVTIKNLPEDCFTVGTDYPLPESVHRFIQAFDDEDGLFGRGELAPFAFTMKRPK